MFHGHWYFGDGILVMGPSNVPCTFLQMIFLTHQCILPHSQCFHRSSCKLYCSYWWFCLDLLVTLRCFKCPASLEMHVYSMSYTDLLQALSHTFYIWDYNVTLCLVCTSRGFLLLLVFVFVEDLLYSPPWVFACSQYFFKVLQFLFSQLWSRTDGMSSMCQCVNDTVLGSNIVVTVPWEVQVSMGGFSVHPYCKLPSSSGLMMVSRKGMEPSSFASSTVNWIEGSTVLMCWRNCCWCFCCCITKVSSTYLFQTLGGTALLL